MSWLLERLVAAQDWSLSMELISAFFYGSKGTLKFNFWVIREVWVTFYILTPCYRASCTDNSANFNSILPCIVHWSLYLPIVFACYLFATLHYIQYLPVCTQLFTFLHVSALIPYHRQGIPFDFFWLERIQYPLGRFPFMLSTVHILS